MRAAALVFLVWLSGGSAWAQTEVNVTFDSAPGVTLAGTVSIPNGSGPFPAVVIASGSGGQNRDGGPGGGLLPDSLVMYRRLAHALTERGILVLRVDDRGMGESTLGDDPQSATSLDLVDDIVAGAEVLAARPDVRWVGVVGHSEGGILAPLAADRSDAIDGLVLVAATAERGLETILDQNRTGVGPLGMSDAQVDAVLAPIRELFEMISATPDADLTDADLARARALYVASNAAIPSDKAAALGLTPERIEAMADAAVPSLTSRAFRTMLALDPARYLAGVAVPTLGLFFSLDQQVPPARNAGPMRQALGASASPAWQVTTLSGINHVMQTAVTGAVAEYAGLASALDPAVPRAIADWVLEAAALHRSDNDRLKALHDQDQADRRQGHGADWTAISRRDAERRREVRALLDAGKVRTAADHYHAAMVFQHGGDSTSFRMARDLARESDRLGHDGPAAWLAAAAHDRYELSLGKPQHYGTQFVSLDGGAWYLSAIDTTAVSDAERQRVGARTLDEIRAYLAQKNGTPTGSLDPPPSHSAHHSDGTVELVGGLDGLVETLDRSRLSGAEGVVRVEISITEQGTVSDVFVVDGLTAEADAEVVRAVRQARFVNHTGGPWEIRLAVPIGR